MKNNLKLGLLGNGIKRSSSPRLHILLGELIGKETTYDLFDLSEKEGPVSIEDELKRCADAGYDGVNVTHPYKIPAYDFVEVGDHLPKGLRSVNTVVFRDGKMIGDNTDYSGFCRGYENIRGVGEKPGRVLQLGAGGVGFALSFGTFGLGAEEIVIHDMSEESATRLRDLLIESGANARLSNGDVVEEMKQADGLVNATPLGMFQYPGSAFPKEGFGGQKWSFDAVYTPMVTEFIQDCNAHDITVVSGFQLFFFQGVNAFEKFSQEKVDAVAALAEYQKRFVQD
jgi:shikimate dehydrogenase